MSEMASQVTYDSPSKSPSTHRPATGPYHEYLSPASDHDITPTPTNTPHKTRSASHSQAYQHQQHPYSPLDAHHYRRERDSSHETSFFSPRPATVQHEDPLNVLRRASLAAADPLSHQPIHSPPGAHLTAPPTPPFGTSKTKPFSLEPLPYSDADVPPPEPYNRAYPHPLSAYASLGVNEETRRVSGYDKALLELYNSDPEKLRGTILSEAGRDDLLPPALTMLIFPGEGNGIPERLWSRFESFGAARVPVGSAGMPSAQNPNQGYPQSAQVLPPRMASLSQNTSATSISSTMSAYGSLSAHPSLTSQPKGLYAYSPSDVSGTRHSSMTTRSIDDYFSLPRQSVRHSASLASLSERHISRNALSRGSIPSFDSRDPVSLPHPHAITALAEQCGSSVIDPFCGDGGVVYAESKSYKTQICGIWEEMGHCKYGNACHYAHGLGELRAPLQGVIPPPTPPPETANLSQSVNQHTTPPHTLPNMRSSPSVYSAQGLSIQSPSRTTSRSEVRRASAPPIDLSTVDESHEAASWHSTRPTITPEDVLPIGAERLGNTKKSRRYDHPATQTLSQSQSQSQVQSQTQVSAQVQARRNGRSPDLATMAEWFSSHPRDSSLHPSTPGNADNWLRVDVSVAETRQGDSTPRASTSSLSSSSGQTSQLYAQPIPSGNYQLPSVPSLPSMSTSMSSSLHTLQTPLSASMTSSWGLDVDVASSGTGSISGSAAGLGSNPSSFGSAYGKKVESTLNAQQHDTRAEMLAEDDTSRQGGGEELAGQGKGNLASTTWDFSTGKSIWC